MYRGRDRRKKAVETSVKNKGVNQKVAPYNYKGEYKTMKRTVKTIGAIAIMGIMLTGAYILGTTQADTITLEMVVEIVPDGYIDSTSEDFYNNYLDMRSVTDFRTDGNGLLLYCNDGSGYYWER